MTPIVTPASTYVANLRDIGGIALRGGGATRSGVMLRSGAPRPGEGAPAGLAWPPRTVIDLRSAAESSPPPYNWHPGTRVLRFDIHQEAAARMEADAGFGGWNAIYAEILVGLGRDIAPIMRAIVDSPGATLVHCAAGKDRTGVLVGALLTLAGADPEAITADYLASRAGMRALAAQWAGESGADVDEILQSPWLSVSAEALHRVLTEITADGPETWFLDHGVPQAHLDAWTARIRS
ncbi:MAG: tyrosine-protein phosphatase [Nocardioidaceae bacterium]